LPCQDRNGLDCRRHLRLLIPVSNLA
jgi:hypothetical protein